MIVEFTGIPGAGKSTAAEVFSRELELAGHRVVSRETVVKRYIRSRYCRNYSHDFALRRPVTLLYRSGLWARHLERRIARRSFAGLMRPESRLAGLWMTEDLILGRQFLDGAGDGDALVLSEGFAHHLAAGLVWFGDGALRLAMPTPHMESGRVQVVNVSTPLRETLARLELRGTPETWPPRITDLEALLVNFERAIRTALACLAQMPVQVHELDMSGERKHAEERVRTLARTIAGKSQSQGPHAGI